MSRIPIASLANGVLFATQTFASPSNPSGVPVLTPAVGTQCFVYIHDTATPAAIWTDELGSVPLAQPLTTSASGTVPGWIDTSLLPLDLVVALPSGNEVFVLAGGGGAGGGGAVDSVFGRTGSITAQSGDYTASQVGADAAGSASAVSSALSTETGRAQTAEGLLAPKASPAFTGTPTVPTAAALTNTTQAASTAYADAAVGVEATARAAGDALAIPLAQKAAASGVASLDGSSVNAQAPKAHAQGLHGRGGTDTLLNGLEVSDTGANQSTHMFIFGPRTTTTLAFPVAAIQPKTAALTCSLDLAPSSGATAGSGNGFAWMDVCDGPVIDANPYVGTTLRLGNGGKVTSLGSITVCDLSTRNFGATARPLVLSSNWDGSADPQVYLSPTNGAAPAVILGANGNDVIVGTSSLSASLVATTATKGFFFVPTMAGTPTGVPANARANETAMVYDSTGKKLWVYDQVSTSWKGVVVA